MEAETQQPLILVVDDEPSVRRLLVRLLEREGYRAEPLTDGEACLAALARTLPSAVLLDVQLPGLSGFAVLQRLRARHPELPVIMVTAETAAAAVVAALRAGAFDYLTKPIEHAALIATVRNAVERHDLSLRVRRLEREAGGGGYAGIVGRSPAMRELFARLDRLAVSDITVLLHGESGTGKELVARALHERGGRAVGPLVAVNCAAIPESLQESELFGHEKGAFTGAAERRAGRFEEADGGTLFLDEIGELTPALQAKLLRVLQERTFRRVGGGVELRSDFRLVAATHRDLHAEAEAGRFREDLYYRVAVFELPVPPLRARSGDVELLAHAFVDGCRRELGIERLELAAETLAVLAGHSWPGNVRELQNAIRRAAVLAQDGVIRPGDLPARVIDGAAEADGPVGAETADPATGAPTATAAPEAGGPDPPAGATDPRRCFADLPSLRIDELERGAIEEAIRRADGNLSEACRHLGIGRTTLYRKLDKHGLR